jgi:hypothetical protein
MMCLEDAKNAFDTYRMRNNSALGFVPAPLSPSMIFRRMFLIIIAMLTSIITVIFVPTIV